MARLRRAAHQAPEARCRSVRRTARRSPRSIRPTPLILASALAVAIAAGSLGTLPAAASDRVVVVQAGQTLSEIAAAHGTTVDAAGGAQPTSPTRTGSTPDSAFACDRRTPSAAKPAHRAPAGAAPRRLRRDADRHRRALRHDHRRHWSCATTWPTRRASMPASCCASREPITRRAAPMADRGHRAARRGRLTTPRTSSTSCAPARPCPASPSATA